MERPSEQGRHQTDGACQLGNGIKSVSAPRQASGPQRSDSWGAAHGWAFGRAPQGASGGSAASQLRQEAAKDSGALAELSTSVGAPRGSLVRSGLVLSPTVFWSSQIPACVPPTDNQSPPPTSCPPPQGITTLPALRGPRFPPSAPEDAPSVTRSCWFPLREPLPTVSPPSARSGPTARGARSGRGADTQAGMPAWARLSGASF